MIWRKEEAGLMELEYMTISDGFVVAEGHSNFNFEDSPFEGTLSLPLFYIFKVHDGNPLVLSNNGVSVRVLPKDFVDSLENPEKEFRFPAQWSSDRDSYDLATFALVPFVFDSLGGWKKIYSLKDTDSVDTSLIYAEQGMTHDRSPIVSHVMPSQVLNHFYSWVRKEHPVEHYEGTHYKWGTVATLKLPVGQSREFTKNQVNKTLEERFETRFLLRE